ncbi:thiamine pyrophosphate-dependent dehydrogenase E1 component subunit alpha, partial [Mycobacterium avium]|uniref:thiamine pyrophosphate-dependent dehydrogenase E1 component subunit alpha n=1 Tax=Mycobacterium avium TaxID=1764 RepID=UPI0018C864D6
MTPSAKPSPDIQRRLYALMALMKTADDRLSRGIGTGEFLCVYWPSRGQEAIAAAMGVTLRPDDQLVTTYRGLHDLIGKGVGLEEIYGEMMGRTIGAGRGKGGTMHIAKPEVGVMLSTGIVGAGPPVAVGLAMAARRKGLDRVTVVSFGDGATNTGSFHEAANMAALWDLPIVFVCQNNRYAEMTPTTDTRGMRMTKSAMCRGPRQRPAQRLQRRHCDALRGRVHLRLQRGRGRIGDEPGGDPFDGRGQLRKQPRVQD